MVRFKAKKKEKKKEWTPSPGRAQGQYGWYHSGLFAKHAEQRMRHEQRKTIEDVNQALLGNK